MPTLEKWNKHFENLNSLRLGELADALTTLMNDPMFDQHYHPDFLELHTCIILIRNRKIRDDKKAAEQFEHILTKLKGNGEEF